MIEDVFRFQSYYNRGFFGKDFGELCEYAESLKKNNDRAEKYIENIIRNESISASKISDEWFPQVKVDVFISHSSKDKGLAYALAGWLYKKFKIVSFIDSLFWKYAYDLLEEINNEYSDKMEKPGGGIVYSHEKCLKASQHVDILLDAALHKLIDKTEAVFFLNTENSIQVFNDLDKEICTTYSPWIFSEMLCTQLVRRKSLCDYRRYEPFLLFFEHAGVNANIEKRDLNLSYDVSLSHLDELSEDILNKWNNMDKSKFCGYPLDGLYSFFEDYSKELRDTISFFARKYNAEPSGFLLG